MAVERGIATSGDEGFLKGALIILIAGTLLGLFYNFAGLQSDWGVPWIGEDKLAAMETLDLEANGAAADDAGATSTVSSVSDDYSVDPMSMGMPAPASNPGDEIPDLGRPIQIQLEACKRLHDADAALFIDAREPFEFEDGHIAGAINVPGEQAITDPALLETIDAGGRPIVTYCGGGACELSLNLAHAMMDVGHRRVTVFMGGYPIWEEAGYAVTLPEGTDDAEGEAIAEEAADAESPFTPTKVALWAVMLAAAGAAFFSRSNWTVRISQLVIGGVFVFAGLAKVGDMSAFATDIHNYRVLPIALENLAAMTMPWIEVLAGLALILNVRARGGAALTAAMMIVFTLAVGQAIARDISITCGCFGKAGAASTGYVKLVENLLMTATAVAAMLRTR